MQLTEELKAEIDAKSYRELLSRVRFGPIGDPMFQGESGDYWLKRMGEVRKQIGDSEHVATSKSIGWDR